MITDPFEIERRSFELIENELGKTVFPDEHKPIILRVIHTTADFEYADAIEIHPDALNAWFNESGKGIKIYTDTKMIIAGVNKEKLKKSKLKFIPWLTTGK